MIKKILYLGIFLISLGFVMIFLTIPSTLMEQLGFLGYTAIIITGAGCGITSSEIARYIVYTKGDENP